MLLFWSSFLKDLARWRQDPGGILLWLAIPLVIGGLITLLMDSGGTKPVGTVLVFDEDDSFVSNAFASAFSTGELGEILTVEKVTAEAGARRINDGDGSAMLTIPAGFGNAILNAEPLTLSLVTNPSQTILPGIITEITEVMLDAAFYLHQLFADEIDVITATLDDGEAPDDALLATMSVAINEKIEVVAPYLLEPAIAIEFPSASADEPQTPISLLFMPGIILMAVMFTASGMAGDLWIEREQGTLRRITTSPGGMLGFLAGKALAAAMIVTAVGGLAMIIGFLYHGISWLRLPSALAWLFISGMALWSGFALLQSLAKTQAAGSLMSSIVLFPLLMAGGSFFPFAALPDWIAAFGRRTPNGFVADRLTSEITSASAWSIAAQSWVLVVAAAVIGVLLCSWRLQSSFARA